MRKSAVVAAIVAAVFSAPASAETVFSGGRIANSGDIFLGALKFGRRLNNKTTLTPDAIEVPGAVTAGTIVGDGSGMTVAGKPLSSVMVARDGGVELRTLSMMLGSMDTAWPNLWQPGFTDDYQGGASRLTVISQNGRYGISAAVRSSDNITTDQNNVITLNMTCLSDQLVREKQVWCEYLHGIILPGNKSYGHLNTENSIANFDTAVQSDPFNINPYKVSVGMRLDSGVGDGVDYVIPGAGSRRPTTASAAMQIIANGADFYSGIQFGRGALNTASTFGIGHAVQMPVNYALTFQHAPGLANTDWRFYAGGTMYTPATQGDPGAPGAAGPLLAEGQGQFQVGPLAGNKVSLQGGASPTMTTTGGNLTLTSATGDIAVLGRLMTPAWVDYMPASYVDAGSAATVNSSAEYQLSGKTLTISGRGSISYASGTRGNVVRVPLPAGLKIKNSCNGTGRENSLSGKGLSVYAYHGETEFSFLDITNQSFVADGASFSFNATCQVQ